MIFCRVVSRMHSPLMMFPSPAVLIKNTISLCITIINKQNKNDYNHFRQDYTIKRDNGCDKQKKNSQGRLLAVNKEVMCKNTVKKEYNHARAK